MSESRRSVITPISLARIAWYWASPVEEGSEPSAGTAKVVIGEREQLLRENESVYIFATQWHRLENPGKVPVEIIEVQIGSYLGEDDILRTDDIYHHTPEETK